MISRRKILSRSRDDLFNYKDDYNQYDDEDDSWYKKEKLYEVIKLKIFLLRITHKLKLI